MKEPIRLDSDFQHGFQRHTMLLSTKTAFHTLLKGKICAFLASTPWGIFQLLPFPPASSEPAKVVGAEEKIQMGWKPWRAGPWCFAEGGDYLCQMVSKTQPCLLGAGGAAVAPSQALCMVLWLILPPNQQFPHAALAGTQCWGEGQGRDLHAVEQCVIKSWLNESINKNIA